MANSSAFPNWAELVNLPTTRSFVHREECTQCFDSQDSPSGIDVCMTCFNGGCIHFNHAANHASKTGHSLALNLKRVRKPETTHRRSPSAEPPLKKLAIPEPVTDQFDLNTCLIYFPPGDESRRVVVSDPVDPKVEQAIAAILASSSSAQVNEVKAWEEELETCHHVTGLEQDPNPNPVVQASATCHGCELSSNLWLCLQCGSLGCGRPQYGGTGGNGHALQHYELTGHCVNVKLGTITSEGSADLYCYSCDDARTDARLQEHLAHFSIEIAKQEKTEKSMTELQVEHNLKFDFSMSAVEGGELRPIQGPGFTGLKNLGNSCYVASVLQVLFALPPFKKRFFNEMFELHSLTCQAIIPAECFECQMNKIAHGILSGRYAIASQTSSQQSTTDGSDPNAPNNLSFQEGIKPMMFKAFIGKGHPEFSTMRQQDADEFMRYFFEFIRRQLRQSLQNTTNPPIANLDDGEMDPTLPFRFELEEKLQCTSCQCVRYRYEEQDALSLPVPAISVIPPPETETSPATQPSAYQPVSLDDCLKDFTTPQPVDYNCPRCNRKTTALTTSRIASFPKYLLVHTRRFAIINWVPKKLEIPVIIQDYQIDLENYVGTGPHPGEEILPDIEQVAPTTNEVPVNQETLSALESMGFPAARCRKAILETGDSGVETAMNWLFEHIDDVEVDTVQPAQQLSHNQEHVAMLMDMGFTSNQAKKALGETDGNVERAVEWLFSHPDDTGLAEPSSANGSHNEKIIKNKETERKSSEGTRYGDKNVPARFKLKGFISHKGPSVFSGHYVAHIRSEDVPLNEHQWVLFNDEKVAVAKHGPLSADSLAP